MNKKKLFASLIGIAALASTIVAWRLAEAAVCPPGKECGWVNVTNVYEYGVPYVPATQNFYNDGATADHLCQMRGYENYTYQATLGQYDKCNTEYGVVWSGSSWRAFKCTSSKWLANIYCARPQPVPNNNPTISWTSAPAAAQCNASYFVSATGVDQDGNLSAVSIDKDGTPFAYGDGGDGSSSTSGNPTSDPGERTVRFTAWANDSKGGRSQTITHEVKISECVLPPQPVYGCTDPGATNYNPQANQDNGSCAYPVKNPVGWLDDVSCSVFTGWASDADQPGTAIDVHFYADGSFVGVTSAGVYRSDVGGHGFSFATPARLRDGNVHSINAYGINVGSGNNTMLSGSGKLIKCDAPAVTDPAPSGSVVASPASLPAGGGQTTVSWAVSNASSCSADGGWSGAKAVSGSESVSVTQSSTFSLSCSGAGGVWNGSASVSVANAPTPSCQDPRATNYGGSLPCSFAPITTTCQDPLAANYGAATACTYGNAGGGTGTTGGGTTGGGTTGGGTTGGGTTGGAANQSGFTISSNNGIVPIKFIGALGGISDPKTIEVNPVGGFSDPVTLSIASIRSKAGGAALPPGVSVTYSFDGADFATTTSSQQAYSSALGRYTNPAGAFGAVLKVSFSKSVSEAYDVVITGVSGTKSASYTLTVDPKAINPNFQEI